eukprot:612149-Amphidinium_carterae.2
MEAAYLRLDRPELQYAVKKLCRNLVSPTLRQHCALERSAGPAVLWAVGSTEAGNLRTRRSTSGMVTFPRKQAVAFKSKTQFVIALSTGEAELYSLVSAVDWTGFVVCDSLSFKTWG